MEDMKKSILKIVTTSSQLTATGIAKKLGKAKASNLMKNALSALVDENKLITSEIGRFVTYSKASRSMSISGKKAEDKIISASKVEKIVSKSLKPGSLENIELPENFKVDDGSNGLKTYTDGNGRKFRLKSDESLLIINGKVECKAKTPEAAEKYVRYWCQKNNLDGADVVVKEAVSGTSVFNIGKGVTFNNQRFLNWEIQKINKAA